MRGAEGFPVLFLILFFKWTYNNVEFFEGYSFMNVNTTIDSFYYHPSPDIDNFMTPELSHAVPLQPPSFPPQPLAITDLFSIGSVFLFREIRLNGIIQYVTFWNCLLSLRTMSLIFIRVVACSLLLLSSSPLFGCTKVCLNIHPLEDILVVSSFYWLWRKLL